MTTQTAIRMVKQRKFVSGNPKATGYLNEWGQKIPITSTAPLYNQILTLMRAVGTDPAPAIIVEDADGLYERYSLVDDEPDTVDSIAAEILHSIDRHHPDYICPVCDGGPGNNCACTCHRGE